MSTRHSTLLRWTEEADAEEICAIAMFEHEPQDATACPVARTGQLRPGRLGQVSRWLRLSRLVGEGVQMIRDGGR
ncbi:MAG: hypothetical protein ACREE2_00025 [Stellaceae bacterium]